MRITMYGEEFDVYITDDEIMYIISEMRDTFIMYKFKNHYQIEINTRFGTTTGWYKVEKHYRRNYEKVYHEYVAAKIKEKDK